MTDKINELKDAACTLIDAMKSKLGEGIEHVDTKEMGEVADIVKDLYEAAYYSSVVKAMEEGNEYDEMLGYTPNRSSTTGRFIRGYNPCMPEYFNNRYRMGYQIPENSAGENSGKLSEANTRYGRAYNDYRQARRYFTETKSPDAKNEMRVHADEHLSDTITTLRDIWADADPEMRKRMKNDLMNLVSQMEV